MTLSDLWLQCNGIFPELAIAVTLCAVILVDMLIPLERSRVQCGIVSLAGIIGALAILALRLMQGSAPYRLLTFNGMIVHDQISVFFRILFLLGAGAVILFSMRSREVEGYRHGEYCSLLLGAVLGAMLLVAADNFVLFMLGFETLSICSYVLAGFIKHERPSAEASLKYMIYGAVASGVMLFGISYLYGMTGTLSIGRGLTLLSRETAGGQLQHLPVFLVLLLVYAGIGFKMAMVPFHFWCPDVYQGAPTPITAFLAVVSKAAGFGALLRLMSPFFTSIPHTLAAQPDYLRTVELPVFFGVMAVVTMTFGNLAALRQTDVKRLLGYSSIAHAGYLLMGMTVYDRSSIEAMMFYFLVYLFMNLGAFWVVIVLVNRLGGAEIERFKGAALKAPFLFAAMFIFLISLTGLPPTAGFVGKFMLFKVVIGAGVAHMTAAGVLTPMAVFYFGVALIGLLNSAISLYYYMTIAKAMAFDPPADETPFRGLALDHAYALLFAVPTVALLYFAPILQLIQMAGR